MKNFAIALSCCLAAVVIPVSAEEFLLVDSYVDGQDGITGFEVGNNSLALSPDGQYLYVSGGHFAFSGSPDEGSLVVFRRNQSSGRLTHLQTLLHGVDVAQMVSAADVVVSPDGQHVYMVASTTSFFSGRYIQFSREADTGLLSEVESYAGGFLNRALVMSPDGSSVYVGGGHGLLSLSRATDGTLTLIEDSEEPIYEVDDMATSPDGSHLYIAGRRCARPSGVCTSVHGVGVMSRDETTGALVSETSIERDELFGAGRITVSPDGQYVYVHGSGISAFLRNSTDGSLTFISHLPSAGGGNSDKMLIRADGTRLFINGVLVDSTDPTALQVAGDIFEEAPESPTSNTADPDFNHIYSIGYNGETETRVLSLLYAFDGPIPDTDGDGVVDPIDNCPNTSNASQQNTDGDLEGDACDGDDDNDTMPDSYELANGLDPLDAADANADADGDGATNLEEFRAETDPQDPDDFPPRPDVPIAITILLDEEENQ